MTCTKFNTATAEVGDTKVVGNVTYQYKGNDIWEAITASLSHTQLSGRNPADGTAHNADDINTLNSGTVQESVNSSEIRPSNSKDFVNLVNTMIRPEKVFARKISVSGADRIVISTVQAPEHDGVTYMSEYTLKADSDGLMKLHNIYSGQSKKPVSSSYNAVLADLQGSWTFGTNSFTTTVGDGFSINTALTESVDVWFYTDNRGGLWNVKVLTMSGVIVSESLISCYSSVASTKSVKVFSGDLSNYKVIGKFLGDDPENAPTSTARGWLQASTKGTLSYVDSSLVGTLSNTGVKLVMSGSVYEFAINVRKLGSSGAYNWIPDHGVATSVRSLQERSYLTGSALSIESYADLPYNTPVSCDSFTLIQTFNGYDVAANELLIGGTLIHKFTKDGIDLSFQMRAFVDIEQTASYMNMMPAYADNLPKLKATRLSMVNSKYSEDYKRTMVKDNSSTFLDYTGSVARWGEWASGRPMYHAMTIKNQADSYGLNSTTINADDGKESLFIDRGDGVAKMYWNFCKTNTVIPSGTYVTANCSITTGIGKSPLSGASSLGAGLI